MSDQTRIMKKLFRMELCKGGSMQEHLRMIFERLNELNEMGAPLDDSVAVSVILASLNSEYDELITDMAAWDKIQITLASVKSKLIEEWNKSEKGQEVDVSMVSNMNFNDRTCFYCEEEGHILSFCPKWSAMNEKQDLRQNQNINNNKGESAKIVRFNKW